MPASKTEKPASESRTRLKVSVRGAVQGVGFRPFVFRLATELGLAGWVQNTPGGVLMELDGPQRRLHDFLDRLDSQKPPLCFIQSLESAWLESAGYVDFKILKSETSGARHALVLPDVATCPDCLREVFDPNDRRYLYPFTNCTHCGPRYSIIEALPYDRRNTSMKGFDMCSKCQAEYDDPVNRRFHAQPNACPVCGPHLELWNPGGDALFAGNDALQAAARAVRRGKILALKGLGGFHLIAAAHDETAVRLLRARKQREEKPLAVMFPSVDRVKAVCELSPIEERLLRSPEAPIVLSRRRNPSPIVDLKSEISNLKFQIAEGVAPGNPTLGVLLAYTPLHHLLLDLLGFPVVATSGNLSDEPICIDEREALTRLGSIADVFLVHDRPIVRHVDDSVMRVMLDRELVLRRARGFAPLPVTLPGRFVPVGSPAILAVGAHLKNSVALAIGPQVFLSQHIGDLETDLAYQAFSRVIDDLETLYESRPAVVAADLHPDYLSTRYALARCAPHAPGQSAKQRIQTHVSGEATGCVHAIPRHVGVQHHIAHVLACMAENEVQPPALGVAWDGTGYGPDGTIWGGEFFHVTDSACERIAHLRQFRLPGGDRAVKEPRRSAIGLLYETFGDAAFAMDDLPPFRGLSQTSRGAVRSMLRRGLNSPFTSSAGRLFDAVAALAGLRQTTRFEGQAAMELEFALEDQEVDESYPISVPNLSMPIAMASEGAPWGGIRPMAACLDWSPMVRSIVKDLETGTSIAILSARFHNTLAEWIVAVARRAGVGRVVLSGGCFQNRYLTERTVARLRAEGFRAFWHQRVPPNDGGIALGQIIAAFRAETQD